MNEDLACKKVLNCSDVTNLKTIGKYLSEMRCKWENKTSKTARIGGVWEQKWNLPPKKNYWKKE
jgi:hypothetical protein